MYYRESLLEYNLWSEEKEVFGNIRVFCYLCVPERETHGLSDEGNGSLAKWLCTGLQIRLRRFESARNLGLIPVFCTLGGRYFFVSFGDNVILLVWRLSQLRNLCTFAQRKIFQDNSPRWRPWWFV